MASSNSNELPDKQALYGRNLAREERLFRFGEKAKYMALDIPEDDVNDIRVDRSSKGMGWKELAAIGAILAGGGLGYKALDQFGKAPIPQTQAAPTAPAAPVTPGAPIVVPDTEYDVRFYDKDGKLIDVPHIRTKPQ